MSDPTIRISTCRGDGRCPECDKPVASSWSETAALCGCTPCGTGCFVAHERALLTEALRQLHMQELCTFDANGNADAAIKDMEALREERDAAIRQVEEQRHPCPCGKDTASIKWARCYSCRQRDTEELEVMREERDAAIREHQRALGEAAEIAQGLQSKLDEVTRERDEARATLAEEREAMASISAELVRAQVEAGERADRAEALLRECVDAVREAASAAEDYGDRTRAREWDALLAKIREFLP